MSNYTASESRPSPQEQDLQRTAKALKALSDPTRLRIFDLLMEGTHCNCEIAQKLGLALNLISHHLRVLREAGLIEGVRDPTDERWIYYSVCPAGLQELTGALQHLLDPQRILPRTPACGPRKTRRTQSCGERRSCGQKDCR